MITDRVRAVINVRPDFWQMEQTAREHYSSPRINRAGITVWKAPGDHTVIHFACGTDLTAAHASEIVAGAAVPEGGHLIVSGRTCEQGLDQALQDAEESATITVLEKGTT